MPYVILIEYLEEKAKKEKTHEPLSTQIWNACMIAIILFNLSTIPFRIAFMHPYDRVFLWADLFSFSFYLADFCMKFRASKTSQDKQAQERIVRDLLNQNEREQIRKQFDSFDKDRNGHITSKELKHVMLSIGENPSEEELKKIIAEVDSNKNGTIEFNEFCDVLRIS